jgi:2-amino-4-hydroxy-6-hydroxymethyldihydropteridine diphosphokinase
VTAEQPVCCYIAIGSNQGERLALCEAAIAQLSALPQSTFSRRSTWYETEPVFFDVGARKIDGIKDYGIRGKANHFNPYPLIPIQPLYPEPAPGWFINGVVELTTTLAPRRLLDECLRIERQFGRTRTVGPGAPLSRPIDLDLLFYGGAVISEPGLTIPHPRLHLRRFVLAPMAELAPGLVHPALRATIADLLNRLADDHVVHRLEPTATTVPDRRRA